MAILGNVSRYGGLLPNQNMPNPTYLENGNVNTWINNNNWEGSWVEEIPTGIVMDMIRQTSFDHLKFASRNIPFPRNSGSGRVSIKRLRPLGISVKPLPEAELPERLVGGSEKGYFVYNRYAAYMQITDVEYEQNPDEVWTAYSEDLMRSAMESMDIITRETLYKGASKGYMNGATTVDEVINKGVIYPAFNELNDPTKYGAQLTVSGLREFKNRMKKLKVPPSFGNKYYFLMDVDGLEQLKRDQELKSWVFSTDPSMFLTNEMYSFGDMVFYTIENAKRVKGTGANADKECGVCFLLGADAYATVQLEGSGIQIIKKEQGSAGTLDPVNQISTLAYKIPGWGVGIYRSEAIIAIHYAFGEGTIVLNGIKYNIDPTTGDVTVDNNAPYTFSALKDMGNIYMDMSDIWDGTVIYPLPYPTDQNTYVQSVKDNANSADGGTNVNNIDAMKEYLAPGLDKNQTAPTPPPTPTDISTITAVTAPTTITAANKAQVTEAEVKTALDPNVLSAVKAVDSALTAADFSYVIGGQTFPIDLSTATKVVTVKITGKGNATGTTAAINVTLPIIP